MKYKKKYLWGSNSNIDTTSPTLNTQIGSYKPSNTSPFNNSGAGQLQNNKTNINYQGDKTTSGNFGSAAGYATVGLNGLNNIMAAKNNPNLSKADRDAAIAQANVDTAFAAVGTAIPVVGAAYAVGSTADKYFDTIGTGKDKVITDVNTGEQAVQSQNEFSQRTGDFLGNTFNPAKMLPAAAEHAAKKEYGKWAMDIFLPSLGTALTQGMDRNEENKRAASLKTGIEYTDEQTNRSISSARNGAFIPNHGFTTPYLKDSLSVMKGNSHDGGQSKFDMGGGIDLGNVNVENQEGVSHKPDGKYIYSNNYIIPGDKKTPAKQIEDIKKAIIPNQKRITRPYDPIDNDYAESQVKKLEGKQTNYLNTMGIGTDGENMARNGGFKRMYLDGTKSTIPTSIIPRNTISGMLPGQDPGADNMVMQSSENTGAFPDGDIYKYLSDSYGNVDNSNVVPFKNKYVNDEQVTSKTPVDWKDLGILAGNSAAGITNLVSGLQKRKYPNYQRLHPDLVNYGVAANNGADEIQRGLTSIKQNYRNSELSQGAMLAGYANAASKASKDAGMLKSGLLTKQEADNAAITNNAKQINTQISNAQTDEKFKTDAAYALLRNKGIPQIGEAGANYLKDKKLDKSDAAQFAYVKKLYPYLFPGTKDLTTV